MDVRQELRLKELGTDSRLIIIGDVHGCIEPLKELLEKVKFKRKRDLLVFTGDLVNKGPSSCEVIDLALSLGAWSVRGNHDDYALACYHEIQSSSNKGHKLSGSDEWIKELTKNQVKYLESLPFILEIPCLKIMIVHAGLVPGVPMEYQKLEDLYKMRTVKQKESGWIGKELWEEGIPWIQAWNGPEHVIFGHDAWSRLQLTNLATGLDTGCVYGGELAAAMIPIGELLTEDGMLTIPNGFTPTRENLDIQIVRVSNNAKKQ